MRYSHRSGGGHFLIHYEATGTDAPSPIDNNANGIPDYIDSVDYYMEYAWDVEINQYGFQAPPPDNLNPGQGGPDGLIDVYICNLPSIYYGAACPESNNPSGNGVASYLMLDNDYKGYPTPGIKGLRVTSAHEFNHILQFIYRYDLTQRSIYEATAVWFERQVHPDIPDYRQYVDSLLIHPQDYGLSTNRTTTDVTGYAHELYLEYLSKRFGRNTIREIWEAFEHEDQFAAIDDVLHNHSFSLENSYCEFAEWCYYTGSRARDTMYLYDAVKYPTMRPAATRRLEPASENLTVIDSLYALSFGLYRLVVPTSNINLLDTVDFVVTNARPDIGKGTTKREAFTLEIDRQQRTDFTQLALSEQNIYYRLTVPSSHFCLYRTINGAVNSIVATRISPQPFLNDGGNQMVFAVDQTQDLIHDIKVWIYTSAMTRVREIEQKELTGANHLLGVVWDGLDNNGRPAPSGIYIYEMSVNGGEPTLGKFAVVSQ
jgi:hypothetical protein